MKGIYEKCISPVICVILTCALGYCLQSSQEHLFFYREQQQIFLFDSDYISNLANGIGGVATLLSQYLIQFFKLPYMGATITAAISGATAWFLWISLKRINNAIYLMPLSFVPLLFQSLYLMNENYHYEGLVAMLAVSASLALYSMLSAKVSAAYRCIIGSLLALALFFCVGSAATLFAIAIALSDALRRVKRWYFSLSPLVLILVSGALCVIGGHKPSYDHIFWMKDYVDYFVDVDMMYGLSWQSLIVVMLIFGLSTLIKVENRLIGAIVAISIIAGGASIYIKMAEKQQNNDKYTLIRLFHYIESEQWNEILRCKEINRLNLLHMNCVNLALSKTGRLTTDLFKYQQYGIESLMSKYQSHLEESFLFSQIYDHLGMTALAYNLAFGCSVGFTHGSPTMTKILIKSHLIFGKYQAAEKFISLLEKSWGYSEWATTQRRFLNNDEAVDMDPELGNARRGLTKNRDLFANIIGLGENLDIILENNPNSKVAMDYRIATLLLTKNMPGIKMLVEKYGGTEALPTLPPLLQQAVISYAEHDPAYCMAHGVSEELLSKFLLFKRQILNLRHSKQDLALGLANYKDTFWYYLLLVK